MEENANIQDFVNSFFEKLWVSYENLETSKEAENIYYIKIKTEESGLLIGPHGKNIESIERLLKLLISSKLDEKIKLHLEVNDYMHSKDERLFRFVKSKIDLVKRSGRDFRMPFLTAYERKKVHSFIAELNDEKIITKSIWEGKERRLHILKADEKLTIDIDGDDI